MRTHIPRLHRINHHQPPREKSYNNPLSARCSSVSCCAGSSVQFSSNYACVLSPFAYLYATITTQRLCCSGSVTGVILGIYVTDPILNFVTDLCTTRMCYDGILLLLLQQAAAAACGQCDLHCQQEGQQQCKSTAVSRCFLALSSCAYCTTNNSAVHLARSSAVGTL